MIVVDIETTGLSPAKCSILSIGAVDFSNPKNEFYEECRIWIGAYVDPEALKVNGFTREQISDESKKPESQIVAEFISWSESVTDRTLAGSQTSFDRDFLRFAIQRAHMMYTFGYHTVDLHSVVYANMMSKKKRIPQNYNRTAMHTDAIHVYCGLEEEPKPHNALVGAKMEAESFSRLIHGRGLLEEYKKFNVPVYLKKHR